MRNSGINSKQRGLGFGALGLVALFAGIFVAAAPCHGHEAINHPPIEHSAEGGSILILHAYHQGLASTNGVNEGFLDVFAEYKIDIDFEYMDTKRHPDRAWVERLAGLYAEKYRHRQYDLIVGCDDNAALFLLEFGKALFGDTPVLICGVNNEALVQRAAAAGYGGIRERIDPSVTATLIARLSPQAQRVVFLSDQTETGKAVTQDVKKHWPTSPRIPQLDIWEHNDFSMLSAQLAELDESTVVLLGPLVRDKYGHYLDFRSVGQLAANHSAQPVYAMWSMAMGSGILGGDLLDMRVHGRQAAMLSLLVLQGRNPAAIGFRRPYKPNFVFDHAQLKRFEIAISQLPASSVVLDRPITFYARYKLYIWLLLGFVFLQTLSIILLLVLNHQHRRRSAAALRRSEKRYRSIVEDAHHGICRFRHGMILSFANEAFSQWVLRKQSQLHGVRLSELLDNQAIVDLETALVELNSPRDIAMVETQLPAADGSIRYLRWSLRCMGDPQAEDVEFQAIIIDVTQQHEAQWLSQRLALAVQSTADCVIVADPQGRIEFVNEAFTRVTGYSAEEVVGKTPTILKSGFSSPSAYEHMWQKLNRGEPWSGRLINRRKCSEGEATPSPVSKNGITATPTPWDRRDLYWAHVTVSPVMDEYRQVVGFVSVERDVTSEVESEMDLLRAADYQKSIVETAATAIFTINRDKIITSVNCSFSLITGFSEEEIVGKHCSILQGEPCKQCCGLLDREEHCPIYRHQCTIKAKDGRILTIIKNASVTRDRHGNINGGIESFVDVSELVDARRNAEMATMAKSVFLANMSHEIRTPLTAIIGFTEDVLESHADEYHLPSPARDALKLILNSGYHLLTLINEILDLSKIEAGRMSIEPMPCRAHQIIAELASTMRVRAAAKGLALDVDYGPDLPQRIVTDPTRLRQILVNLLGNAIKFTESGGVRIGMDVIRRPNQNARLHITVQDTGPGIPPEKVEQLFEPFQQGDASTTRKFGGTGLGLTISRKLANRLGGDIEVQSKPGKGSVFTLEIDAGCVDNVPCLENLDEAVDWAADAAETGSPAVKLVGRILLAEDNPTNQKLIERQLRKSGLDVTMVDNGQAAIDMFQRAMQTGSPFDLVLMDVQMPQVDGCEATRRLRSQGYHQPIIALTANAMQRDRDRCLSAGCDDFASKPINRRALIRKLQHYLAPAA